MERPGLHLALRVLGSIGNLGGSSHQNDRWTRLLTQWSLKSPTITAGAKDLAGFMEQPV